MPEQLIEVVQVPEAGQFRILVEGSKVGHIDYSDDGSVRAMPHTFVEPAHRGRGLATALIKEALDRSRAEGLQVLPLCPAIAGYIDKNPDYRDLVPTP